ncbi:hypothetical protein DFA_01248 [Cavenderia fasciculata]|uniref:Uncharacterized protein n=1 Tax=Cavenderia fasciculata TaxID=261658 RepID=F4PRM7_CACFS|nr:uncharacterized protein DFA_01248 [Cavenderia fasciculata]EGG21367.1 hypothetical protein DFA_01248 [Cavenderia fasciculata]|eukprot:XP_004359217.1 hypothetical protein DFA_01248 [Cavenderia fasciculata]
MGEFIYDIQEKVEQLYGQVLEDRQKALPHFTGLGPPDLCVLVKSYEPPKFVPGLKATTYSSYHWVSGLDTSSTSSIAVYLGTLIENQEKSTGFGRGTYKIEGCHFCIYNSFQKMDIHVELGINNSQPTVYSVGANGERNPVEESFWKETYISSVLRSVSDQPAFLRPLKILPCLQSADEESNFLQLCSQHFWQGRKLGAHDGEYVDIKQQPDPEGFEVDDSNNILVESLVNYFNSRNRYEVIVSFFSEFIATESSISTIVARAMMHLNQPTQAFALLDQALHKCPESTSILMEYADCLLMLHKKQEHTSSSPNNQSQSSTPKPDILVKALKYALKSISLKPQIVRHWKIAANLLSQMGQIEWSLIFLNNAPYLKTDTLTDTIGKSKYARVTPPPEHPNMLTVLEDEEIEFDEEPGDDFLKRLTSVSLHGESLEIFNMLVGMYRNVGWLELAERKTKALDQLAQTARGRQTIKSNSSLNNSIIQSSSSSPPHSQQQQQQTSTNTVNSNNENHQPQTTTSPSSSSSPSKDSSKDGHNTSSPINRPKATENLKSPKVEEGLWNDEDDVQSEGSEKVEDVDLSEDLKNVNLNKTEQVEEENKDQSKQEGEGEEKSTVSSTEPTSESTATATTTVEVVLPKEPRKLKVFDQESLQTSEIESLRLVLEPFIKDYGLESTKEEATREFVEIETPNFKARLPVVEIRRNVELGFHALFQDVKAYQSWKDESQTKRTMIDSGNVKDLKHVNATRTFADWVRLGQLSFRLGDLSESEKLFILVQHDKFSSKALSGLTRIFCRVGDIRNCLISSSTLSKYYTDKVKAVDINPIVQKCVLDLIAQFGLQKVRNIHSSISDLSPIIGSLYLDSNPDRGWMAQ